MDIRNRIKSVRHKQRLTCRQLAAKSGIKYTRISRIERGLSPLRWDDIVAIANGFDMSVIELLIPVTEANAA